MPRIWITPPKEWHICTLVLDMASRLASLAQRGLSAGPKIWSQRLFPPTNTQQEAIYVPCGRFLYNYRCMYVLLLFLKSRQALNACVCVRVFLPEFLKTSIVAEHLQRDHSCDFQCCTFWTASLLERLVPVPLSPADCVEIFVSEAAAVTCPTETTPSGEYTPGDEDIWIWESPVSVGHVDIM